MNRGYQDFARLYALHQAGSFFVTRAKPNSKFKRRVSHPVERSSGLICDQIVELTVFYSHQGYLKRLLRIRFKDPETTKTLIFLTNNFTLPALTIGALYKTATAAPLQSTWSDEHRAAPGPELNFTLAPERSRTLGMRTSTGPTAVRISRAGG
jgi:hypothetical protein